MASRGRQLKRKYVAMRFLNARARVVFSHPGFSLARCRMDTQGTRREFAQVLTSLRSQALQAACHPRKYQTSMSVVSGNAEDMCWGEYFAFWTQLGHRHPIGIRDRVTKSWYH
jgi:ribosomal protein L29